MSGMIMGTFHRSKRLVPSTKIGPGKKGSSAGMFGKIVAGGILLGAAFGVSATDDIEANVPPRIQPVKPPVTCYHDAHCPPAKSPNVSNPPSRYQDPQVPGENFLCVENPYSYDCRVVQDDKYGGPVVLR